MTVSRQEDLRANQKERTRAALVEAAATLLRDGSPPTVAEAAAKAKVSRATAYRYFPTPEALLVEVVGVTPVVEPVETMLADLDSDDVEERVLRLVDTFTPIVLAEEPHLRAALRVYLDTWLNSPGHDRDSTPVREGRRMRWLDEALRPARDRLPEPDWQRLRGALALTLGIDAIIVLKDVCHLDNDQIPDVLRWTATTLLHASLPDRAARSQRAPSQKRPPRRVGRLQKGQ